jgi:hypothetical protein
MPERKPLTLTVAQWVAAQRDLVLPEAVDHHMRRMLLDHLAGVVASSVGEVSAAVGAHVGRM